jgi:hypothetical protein
MGRLRTGSCPVDGCPRRTLVRLRAEPPRGELCSSGAVHVGFATTAYIVTIRPHESGDQRLVRLFVVKRRKNVVARDHAS